MILHERINLLRSNYYNFIINIGNFFKIIIILF